MTSDAVHLTLLLLLLLLLKSPACAVSFCGDRLLPSRTVVVYKPAWSVLSDWT